MNILITGATGFVGRHLVNEFRKVHSLHILCRSEKSLEELNLPGFLMTDDIYALAAYIKENNIEGVVHLASLYLASHTADQIKDLILSNVFLGTAILEAASRAGTVRWFLNTGSIWQNYMVEGNAYNPVNLYAATKQSFIDIAKYYVETSKIRFCTLKLCDTYGPDDTRKKILKLFKDCSESGELLKMSPGNQLLDILYISDVVDGFRQLVDMLASDDEIEEQYVLSSENQISLKKLASVFEEVSQTKLNIEWGARNYREREVMVPWKGPVLKNWKAKISLREGIELFLHS